MSFVNTRIITYQIVICFQENIWCLWLSGLAFTTCWSICLTSELFFVLTNIQETGHMFVDISRDRGTFQYDNYRDKKVCNAYAAGVNFSSVSNNFITFDLLLCYKSLKAPPSINECSYSRLFHNKILKRTSNHRKPRKPHDLAIFFISQKIIFQTLTLLCLKKKKNHKGWKKAKREFGRSPQREKCSLSLL